MYEIPSLPFKYSDLEPHIDEETMRVHHTKHHQTYADKLNAALEKHAGLEDQELTFLIRNAAKELPDDIRGAVVNNGGGYLNHNFFWEILGRPSDDRNLPAGTAIGVALDEQFGDYEEFKRKFSESALSLFGSGWTWLMLASDGRMSIENTANQNLPPQDKTRLLVIDIWEHAYYLKYQNRRAEYIDAFFGVVNWPAVDRKLKESGITPAA